ncbi:MAG: ABC transporter permease [Planctomycetes bacterium]|nr:ABC transporter permease [Planctomycetota bacterium]
MDEEDKNPDCGPSEGGSRGEERLRVYTPASQLRTPLRLVKDMAGDVIDGRELTWRLIVRDISARYRQSFLGIAWAFIPPIITAAVFVMLNKASVLNVKSTTMPYPAFVMAGIILWQLFVDSLNAPLRVIQANKALLGKINFPRESLVFAAMGEVLFEFAIKLLLLVVTFIIYDVPLTWTALLAIGPILLLMLIGIMLGVLLTPAGMLYSDITAALPIITTIWLFATPVVYPMPVNQPYVTLTNLNPPAAALCAARDLLAGAGVADVIPLLAWTGCTIGGLLILWVMLRVAMPILIERIGA